MKIPELFHITKGTRVVFSITLGICVLGIAVAALYYRSLNRADDPRVLPVRELVNQSEELSGARKAAEAYLLLDSALNLLERIPGYARSYEAGVIYNNACSAWLLSALYDSTLVQEEKVKMLTVAGVYADSSMQIYRDWITQWGSLTEAQIRSTIAPYFPAGEPSFSRRDPRRILDKRVRDILEAQKETPRRLSVSLTNQGTILRHLNQPDSALVCYGEALKLWKENSTAENNLSVLMGGKPVKPSLIRSLFPPDKNE